MMMDSNRNMSITAIELCLSLSRYLMSNNKARHRGQPRSPTIPVWTIFSLAFNGSEITVGEGKGGEKGGLERKRGRACGLK